MNRFDYDGAASSTSWGESGLSPTGQRRRMAELLLGRNRTVDYSYDALRRLLQEKVADPAGGFEVSYGASDSASTDEGYDLVGNRRSRTVTGAEASLLGALGLTTYAHQQSSLPRTHIFDERDHLLGADPAAPSLHYDANGNTTSYRPAGQVSAEQFLYDAENRLIQRMLSGAADVQIQYDAEGNRVAKTAGAVTTYYLVDDVNPTGYAQVLAEYVSTNSAPRLLSRAYVYGLDLISQTLYTPISEAPPEEPMAMGMSGGEDGLESGGLLGLSMLMSQNSAELPPMLEAHTWYYGYDGLGSTRVSQ